MGNSKNKLLHHHHTRTHTHTHTHTHTSAVVMAFYKVRSGGEEECKRQHGFSLLTPLSWVLSTHNDDENEDGEAGVEEGGCEFYRTLVRTQSHTHTHKHTFRENKARGTTKGTEGYVGEDTARRIQG